MRRDPHEESIYTLQRRLGTQPRVLDDPPEPDEPLPPAAKSRPQPKTSTLGRLFLWRVRAAA